MQISEEPAIVTSSSISWASAGKKQVSVTLPKSLPSGEYLLRVEHVALHTAGSANGAQFYLSCAQINVQNGGSGSPSPLVSFPGAYKNTDAGKQQSDCGIALTETDIFKVFWSTSTTLFPPTTSPRARRYGGARWLLELAKALVGLGDHNGSSAGM
jgi:hypothetical protein